MNAKKAIAAIDSNGILLVYPIDNRPAPPSLWSVLYPRSPMRWEWDDGGDDRVSKLWHLRAELSSSSKVVYTKWYRGRATFFSREVFAAVLALLGPHLPSRRGLVQTLSREARNLLEAFEMDSPLSTKQVKLICDLKGKLHERVYERAMKELWANLLIVGFGEVDDGAFPSLAVGATRVLFEDLWAQAGEYSRDEAEALVRSRVPEGSPFISQLEKLLKKAE